MESFGARLKKKRVSKGLTQDELAGLMQKSGKAVISAWEKNRTAPCLLDIRKLAKLLDTTAAWLVDGIGEDAGIVSTGIPNGFTLVRTKEFIALQKQVIKQQKQELQKQK
jgi:transcriptional regulator with XRE-family HTH domain